MDGSSIKEIIRDNTVSAITIDRTEIRIFWATANAIRSSNYNGKEISYWTSTTADVLSLVVSDNKLYWLLSHPWTNSSTIYSCKRINSTCQGDLKIQTTDKFSMLKFFPAQNKTTSSKNPCKENFLCEHLCLLSSEGTFSCSCKIGYILNVDRRTCKKITSYFVFARSNHFYGRTLDYKEKAFVRHAFSPVKFNVDPLKHKKVIDFDQSWFPNEIIFCGDRQIYKLNISSRKQTEILQINNSSYIGSMAVDQQSKNLYYIKISLGDDRASLQILTIRHERVFNKHLIDIGNIFDKGHSQLAACKKYLFHANQYDIDRMLLKGKLENSIRPLHTNIQSFAIDCNQGIIYEFEKKVASALYAFGKGPAFKTVLEYKDYHSIYLTNFILLKRIEGAYFHNDYLFITDFTTIVFFKADSSHTASNIVFQGNKKRNVSGLKVFEIQSSYDHCKILKSLDCEQFCFSEPTIECGCEINLRLFEKKKCI